MKTKTYKGTIIRIEGQPYALVRWNCRMEAGQCIRLEQPGGSSSVVTLEQSYPWTRGTTAWRVKNGRQEAA